MLPTFFVIGAPKTGTTSLHEYLALHPDVHMPENKEPHFFAPRPGAHPFGRVETLAEYEALFESDAPVRGESSVGYAGHPFFSGVPERIAELVPDARFVYVVRDPIERAVSHYYQRVWSVGEPRSLNEVLGALDDPDNRYTWASRYMTQVERFLRCFPASSMLVVDQADLKRRRRDVLAEIFAFLGVDPSFDDPGFDVEHNVSESRRAFTRRHHRVRRSIPVRALRKALPPRATASFDGMLERALKPPIVREEIAPEVRARLIEVFGDEAVRLREFTGRDFASWPIWRELDQPQNATSSRASATPSS